MPDEPQNEPMSDTSHEATEGADDRPPQALEPRTLSGKQRRSLRALGHHLDPVVQVGKQGLTPALARAAEDALTHHQLIKVRVGTECAEDRGDVAAALGRRLGAHVAQALGRTILLYRRNRERPPLDGLTS